MKRALHKTSLHIGGTMIVVVGLAGLVLPVIPGVIFIALGFYMISNASEWLGTKIEHLKIQYPRFGFHYDRLDSKVSKIIKKAY